MAAATVEPVKAQKLRIMFKGAKLVEISTPARGATAAADVVQPSIGLKPLNTSGRNGGGDAQHSPGLPADLVDFLSREMEDCLSPLGSWVDETLAGTHAAPGELAEAPQHPTATDMWPPSLHLQSKGREGDAHPWWEQAATPGGRSSEGCSTQEAALMDVPSPGSVSNSCAPMLRAEPYRQPSRAPQPTLSAWPPSQGLATADTLDAAAKVQPQEKPRPHCEPSRTSSQHAQPASQPGSQPRSQPRSQQPLRGQASQHRMQSQQQAPPPPKPRLQQRPQAKPRPKPVDWLAEEATPITASPRREAPPAVQQRPPTAAGGGAARARSGSVPLSAPSSPQVHRGTPPPQPLGVRHSPSPTPLHVARSAKPAVLTAGRAGSSNLGRKPSSSALAPTAGGGGPAAAPNGKAGVKRKGSPEAARASAPKRAPPGPSASPSPSPRPAAKPAASNLSRTAPPGGGQPGRPTPAAGRADGGGGGRQPSPPPVLSRAAADGQPLGGFGSGQWHGFREGQIVWAKMPGYPHWPAQVQQPTQDAWDILEPAMQRPVFVVFFGTKDFQWLAAGKLSRFRESYRARASIRNPDLQRALNDAWWHIGEPKP